MNSWAGCDKSLELVDLSRAQLKQDRGKGKLSSSGWGQNFGMTEAQLERFQRTATDVAYHGVARATGPLSRRCICTNTSPFSLFHFLKK